MSFARKFTVATVAAMTLSTPLFAEEAPFKMPEQCATTASAGEMPEGHAPAKGMHGSSMDADAPSDGMKGMKGMMGMNGMETDTMPEHVQENMRRMMVSMPAMHDGMMNEDPNVAFACGMIAHHQGAIDMAQVLLEYGDNAEMIKLAGEIIAAQVGEIEEMTAWLEKNAK